MELRVIELIRVGLRNKQIARQFSISEKTVKVHLNNIYRKLGLQNRYMLAEFSRKLKRRVR
jgi:DNA-binding NarL/FixJ family response regulator